mmetsp:Transcript_49924/g.126984  ORF Transcript_49924/g.126984 Transcript_49924/m.126984 type:complete len:213 (-) Transcript_49924:187-825(-)
MLASKASGEAGAYTVGVAALAILLPVARRSAFSAERSADGRRVETFCRAPPAKVARPIRRAARGEAPAWVTPATTTVGESKRRPSSSALAATRNCTAGGANAARGGGAIVVKGVGASYTALGNGCSGLTAALPSITTTALRPARAPRDRPVPRSTEMESASAEAPKARPGNAEEAPSKAGAAATTAAAAPARAASGARPPRVASGWTKAPPA